MWLTITMFHNHNAMQEHKQHASAVWQMQRRTMSESKGMNYRSSKTAIKVVNGNFDYPSTRGKGYDPIDYQRRAPTVAGKLGALETVTIKMRDCQTSSSMTSTRRIGKDTCSKNYHGI
jgi:hypothetical protein